MNNNFYVVYFILFMMNYKYKYNKYKIKYLKLKTSIGGNHKELYVQMFEYIESLIGAPYGVWDGKN